MSEDPGGAAPRSEEPDEEPAGAVCAFCGSSEDVGEQERLGVRVRVCAGCTARFGRERRAQRAAGPPERPVGLPPTLGQQSSEVLRHVARMAERAAARPYAEEECPRCRAPVHVYRAVDGEGRVVLAKDAVLAESVPAATRWRVRDGRAEPSPGEPEQVGARVLHEVVCGAAPEPGNPRLQRAWRANRDAAGAAAPGPGDPGAGVHP
ncbi:DUF6083 domain-containing protein [Kineococcus esterisolvens]|uniref:DUF6083 domain-containing protein n=1 Tax=unclassified Kineococcus TaxID=2621656 RepID=UPI003D7E5C0C